MSVASETIEEPTFLIRESKLHEEKEDAVDLNSLLMEVNGLVQTHDYERARLLLSAAYAKTQGPARVIIARAMDQIKAEEKTFYIPTKINITDIEKIEKDVKDLIEEEKFEEAITRLETIQNPSLENSRDTVGELKQQAVNSLIKRERNRAAEIFLKAKKTNDPFRKQEMLYATREILTTLILNYPNSSLIHTLERNLEVVEQTLEKTQEAP